VDLKSTTATLKARKKTFSTIPSSIVRTMASGSANTVPLPEQTPKTLLLTIVVRNGSLFGQFAARFASTAVSRQVQGDACYNLFGEWELQLIGRLYHDLAMKNDDPKA
jgi:hypothetical protein